MNPGTFEGVARSVSNALPRPFDIQLGTAVATTSGTAIDFTGIPAGVKRITLMFLGVGTSSTSKKRIHIGPTAGVETSGYLGASEKGGGYANFTAGFDLNDVLATSRLHGTITLVLEMASTNTWTLSGQLGLSDVATIINTGGSKPLAGALAILRLTTVNGSDTFAAGAVSISWEF